MIIKTTFAPGAIVAKGLCSINLLGYAISIHH